jgi:hypothetical protein
MPNNRLLASLGVTAALAAGGIGAAWLAAPAISGAQTTAPSTTMPSTTMPSTTMPAPDTGQAPAHTPGNCPHMGQNGGGSGGTGTSGGASAEATSLSWRSGGRFARL